MINKYYYVIIYILETVEVIGITKQILINCIQLFPFLKDRLNYSSNLTFTHSSLHKRENLMIFDVMFRNKSVRKKN